ncbi:MAG TPA: hypothetical protein VJG49_04690 [Candidatus Nanoarchaeia archaeon]|nr:hypothetical protein [Candidatus Nanoarchaeia archaeon]
MIKGHKKDIWEEIKEWQKDPEFIRAAYEFVRYHTGGRRSKSLKSK